MVTKFLGVPDFTPIQDQDHTKNRYGENGYSGPSSDTDLSKPTRSALSVALFPNPKVVRVDQSRDIGKGNVPNAYCMTGPKPSPKVV